MNQTARSVAARSRVRRSPRGPTLAQLGITSPEQQRVYRREVRQRMRALAAYFQRKVGRPPNKGERAVLRRAVQAAILKRYVKTQRFINHEVAKAQANVPPAGTYRRRPKELVYGAKPKGRGRLEFGGGIKRRVHRTPGRKFKLHKQEWIDPFPWIPGTLPEKIIFEALYRRRFYFIFQAEWSDVVSTDGNDSDLPVLYQAAFKPDFVLPEYKVVIDPFGEFVHSLPSAVARDIQKRVLYSALGWTFVTPWAHEVSDRGGYAIVDEIPDLHRPPVQKLNKRDQAAKDSLGYRLGPNLGAGATSTAMANRLRKRPPTLLLR